MSQSARWRALTRPLLSIRARSTAAALLVVAVALAAGAALLLVLLHQNLISAIDDDATIRAAEVAAQVHTDSASHVGEYLAATNRGGQLVQVLDAGGSVVAGSSAAAKSRPLTALRPEAGQVSREQVEGLGTTAAKDDPYLVVARGVRTPAGKQQVVVVAASLGREDETVDTVQKYLLAGLLPLLLLVAVATWILVGWALRPVERIRARVQRINAARFNERVPVPDTSDEIARLAVTMNEMLDRLQAAQASQRRFVADASHELRSPLATLTLGLDVAGPEPTGDSWGELRAMMQTEAARMRLLVADLLLLAKADDTGLGLEREDVDLDDIVDAEVRRLRMSTGLHVQADIVPVRVQGDTVKLTQAVRNLSENAARAASGQVRLRLLREEGPGNEGQGRDRSHSDDHDVAVIRVEDDGPGIDIADRTRVFERFVRLDESRERGHGGSGLGLAIVEEVVRGHGGSVVAGESDLGGACFEVRLPTR
ncbi:MAG: HAMP domain-containing histidine kinase [Humibacillus sp.]|nr:HAMP domain-containing histidine kinase [Humibacillus sp.]MDN5778036.1 HAMP domain-containing histidine kinase [Humibacillus sp.]